MSMSMRKKRAIGGLVTYLMVIAAYLACQYLLATGGMTRSLRGQLVPICVWVVMAVSLNLVVGVSGELSLGHAGFMSVGAFSGIVASGWMLGAFQLENEVVRLLLSMIVGGVFAGIAGITATSRIYSADTNNIGLNLEMDAILAVALGGNSLGGGKFRLSGSIIGAYTIQAITTTLYALGVSSAQAPVFKAIIVILIVTIQSPAVKAYFAKRAAVKNAMMNAGREAQA